jgi:Zn-dependent protease with chaperone function
MLVMPLMFLLMPGVSPVRIPSEYVRPVLFYGILPFSVLAPLLGSWLASRATHTRLAPDDPTHRMVTEMASAAGVPVKRVVVRRAKELNAYASVLGTVGLTSALLRRMDPDEVRAVVAHELGHHKARDPRRHLLFSLLFTLAALGAWFALRSYLESRVNLSTEAKALLNSPIFAIFILPVLQSLAMGRTHRRAEEAADRFAVDATGDAELVVRALRKLHTLNATPHTLKPSDEALSTHPSLANRIEAIRRYAAEKGSPADG